MGRRLTAKDGIRAWARRHGYSFFSSIGSIVRRPIGSLLTVTMLALTLTLPLVAYQMAEELGGITESIDRERTLSLFLVSDIQEADVNRLSSSLGAAADVLAVDPISPEEGLSELLGFLGMEGINLDGLTNPLPWVLEVLPSPEADLEALILRLGDQVEVAEVQMDLAWIERLDQLIRLGYRLAWILAGFMVVALFVVVANSVRFEAQQRHQEIEVMALVGATPAFIRRPFLYTGLWFGVLSSVLSLGLLAVIEAILAGPLSMLYQTYQIGVTLAAPQWQASITLIIAMGVVGILASALAVNQQLKEIWPAYV